jgi:FkbM family methyltransferase
MKQWRGIWFPEGEEHYIQWMSQTNKIVDGKPTYQYSKYKTALDLCVKRRHAIDIGGNIGLWAMHMSKDFSRVDSFEPVEKYCDVFVKNAPDANLHHCALGAAPDTIAIMQRVPDSCGGARAWIEGDDPTAIVQAEVEVKTLDSFEFEAVDFIKIDCEGYELNILQGAVETIKRNKPIIIVEQKPGHGQVYGLKDDAAVDFLKNLGMKVHTVLSGDYVMVW